MISVQSESYLNQYHNLIRKAAWRASEDVGANFDDALGEAYLIFCEALRKYDQRFGTKFGTYLTHCLRDLKRRVFVVGRNQVSYEILDEIPELSGYNKGDDDFKVKALFMADNDAKVLLDALILGRFDINGSQKGGRQKPGFQTVYRVMKEHDWTYSRCKTAWENLRMWWLEN